MKVIGDSWNMCSIIISALVMLLAVDQCLTQDSRSGIKIFWAIVFILKVPLYFEKIIQFPWNFPNCRPIEIFRIEMLYVRWRSLFQFRLEKRWSQGLYIAIITITAYSWIFQKSLKLFHVKNCSMTTNLVALVTQQRWAIRTRSIAQGH